MAPNEENLSKDNRPEENRPEENRPVRPEPEHWQETMAPEQSASPDTQANPPAADPALRAESRPARPEPEHWQDARPTAQAAAPDARDKPAESDHTPRDQGNHAEGGSDEGNHTEGGPNGGGPDEGDPEKRRHFVHMAVIVAAIAFAVLLISSLISRHRENASLSAEAKRRKSALPQVTVVQPSQVSQSLLTLPGSTEAIEDAVIGARSTGYVRQRFVDIGTHVRAGQVLAVIEAPDVDVQVAQARSQQAQSRALVAQAQADVSSRQATVAQLRANVAQARATLQQNRALLATAVARLAEARHNVDIKRAALTQAQTQLELATRTLARYQTLLRYGYVALQDVDQNQAAYDNAQAAVRSAQSDLAASESEAQANVTTVASEEEVVRASTATVASNEEAVAAAQANVRSGRRTVEANRYAVSASAANAQRAAVLAAYERVTAPFDGVITARNFDVGSLINAGSGAAGSSTSSSGSDASSSTSTANIGSATLGTSAPATSPGTGLFGIAKIDVLRILVSVPQAFAPQIRPGLTTSLLVREYPGHVFQGTVFYIAGALDTASRTLLTEIHVSNQRGALLPGMYTDVQFHLPSYRPVIHIPANTLIVDAQGTRVALVGQNNRLHFQHVRLGRDFGSDIEVLEGLSGQERLVANPTDDLTEGEAVHPITPQVGKPAHGGAGGGGGNSR